MIIAPKSAQLTDITYRKSLEKIFFTEVYTGSCNVGMQGNACTFFKFSGKMFFGNKKFFFQFFQREVFCEMLADICKYIVDNQHFLLMKLVYLVALDAGT